MEDSNQTTDPSRDQKIYKIKDGDVRDLDWNQVEKDKKDGWTIRFYHQPAWSEKRFEYSEEEVKRMLYWANIQKRAETDLEAFTSAKDNKKRNCPGCKEKLKWVWAICDCGAAFCQYCFSLADNSYFTCNCSDVITGYNRTIFRANEEVMKVRHREFQEWAAGAKSRTVESDQ